MRFMILVKGAKDSEAGVMPGRAKKAEYQVELAETGVLVDASGLQVRNGFAKLAWA